MDVYELEKIYNYNNSQELISKPKETLQKDNVNHPSHYQGSKYECIDVMAEALGTEVVKGFCLGNAFKYLYRCMRKNGLEDIKKARWYINKFIELEEKDNA